MTHEQIAKLCHDANRSYRKLLGEPDAGSWFGLDRRHQLSIIDGVLAITSGRVVTPLESHQCWVKARQDAGWRLGPYHPAAKTHPNLIDYHELPLDQQRKDTIFYCLVTAFMITDGVDDAD